MTSAKLVALAKSWAKACDMTGNSETASATLARAVIALHSPDVARLRGEIVEWAEDWRKETCSELPDCDKREGIHNEQCEIERNIREGCSLVDALAIAEHPAIQRERDENRCAVCGWPLASVDQLGCVRGNCSERPRPASLYDAERAKTELAALLATKETP